MPYYKILSNRAIRVAPGFPPAYHLRGDLYVRNGKLKEAQDDYAKSIESQPQDPRAHISLARLLAKCPTANYRAGERAVASATRARELLMGKYVGALNTLAAGYAEKSQLAESMKWQAKAMVLELVPPHNRTMLQ